LAFAVFSHERITTPALNRNYAYLLRLYLRIIDYAVLNLLIFVAIIVRFKSDWPEVFSRNNYLALLLFTNLAWALISNVVRYYQPARLGHNRWRRFFLFVQIVLLHLMLMLAFNGIIKTYYSRLFFVYFYTLVLVVMPLAELLVRKIIRWYREQIGMTNRLAFLGTETGIEELAYYFSHIEAETDEREVVKVDHAGVDMVAKVLRLHAEKPINELFVSLSLVNNVQLQELNTACENNLIRIRLVVDFPKLVNKPLEIINYDSIPVINVPITPLDDPGNKMIKRIFDVVFSLLVTMFLLSWLFPILALLIKFTSRGPIIFTQLRTGADNREFPCLKFRTMYVNENAHSEQATQNDPRITPIGRFLRKTSLDEFPQFINVLRGEMSVVGPRPHMLKHTEEYAQLVGSFMQRHAIRPGVTGLAQVKGYRGEITNYERLSNRVKYDRFYVENWSLMFDVRIVIRTVLAVFKSHL